MDLRFAGQAEAYRAQIHELLAGYLPPDWTGIGALDAARRAEFLARWREFLVENHLIAPGWPSAYGGGGLDLTSQSIVAEEFVRHGVPQYPLPNDSVGMVLLGPTLLHWATEEQKSYFLPRTISAEIRWAQGYSEPEAGSDLFNLRTTARLEVGAGTPANGDAASGGQWVINGQKIWQSHGTRANWIFALVRTDPEAVRARGLSFLLIPLDQPGIEVRPIKTMDGHAELSEIFFTDATTSVDNIVGNPGEGAKVALTLLGFERGAGGIAAALGAKIELLRLRELMTALDRNDTEFRRRLAECWVSVHAMHCLALRNLTIGAQGRPPGPESSITKLMTSEYRKRVTELAIDVLGPKALTMTGGRSIVTLGPEPLGFDPTSTAAWAEDYLHARPGTVYGGSSEIQRNTIGEQVLGLPREVRTTQRNGR